MDALAVACACLTDPEAFAAAAEMRCALAAVIGRVVAGGVASPEGRGSTSADKMALRPAKFGLDESKFLLRLGGKGARGVLKED